MVSSILQRLRDVPELVGIAGDVDGGDEAVLDLKGSCLQHVVAFAADIAGQAVDPHRLDEYCGPRGQLAIETAEQAQHAVDAVDRIDESSDLAAAVGL